jgi:ectoine hydroxylase-related dioxygenase (phytanoyl-CoA dioxygenase family)
MVQLFQHSLLDKNRNSPKIRKAYEQLWQRTDLWVNTDRVGFNPPETELYRFPGPHLHWDASIKQPMPFGTQGILYLADTAANQGAFTLVPGFQNRIADWLNGLPEGANPRQQDMHALGAIPIAANAGDFILWHQALPHGSSPNTSALPRFVQYINYEPFGHHENAEWL